jgi:hypothetical protein
MKMIRRKSYHLIVDFISNFSRVDNIRSHGQFVVEVIDEIKCKVIITDKCTKKKYLIVFAHEDTGVLTYDPYPYTKYYLDILSYREVIDVQNENFPDCLKIEFIKSLGADDESNLFRSHSFRTNYVYKSVYKKYQYKAKLELLKNKQLELSI